MLLIYAAFSVLFLSLGAYFYGKQLENSRRSGKTRRQNLDNSLAATSETYPRDTWELVLFSCDYGPTSASHGPARSLKAPKKGLAKPYGA